MSLWTLLSAFAGVARAQTVEPESNDSSQLTLDWRSPAACDQRTRTLDTVRRLLGASPPELSSAPLSASASVTRTASGAWHLLLEVRHDSQQLTRKLEALSCPELADAAALILALVLDPELLERVSKNEASPSPAPTEAVPPTPPAAARVEPQARVPAIAPKREELREVRHTSPFVELGPVVSLGVIPSPAFGVSLSGGFDWERWRLTLTGAFFPSRRADVAPPGPGYAVFELRTLSLLGCWLPNVNASVRLGPCVANQFGSIAARGEDVRQPAGATQRFGATGVGGLLVFRNRRALELGLSGQLALPWGRPEFRLLGTTIHQPAAIVAEFRGFAGVRF